MREGETFVRKSFPFPAQKPSSPHRTSLFWGCMVFLHALSGVFGLIIMGLVGYVLAARAGSARRRAFCCRGW